MSLFIIDRFDDDEAVLEAEGGAMSRVPRGALPENAREGDVLTREPHGYRVDAEATRARRERAREALRRLMNRDL